MVGEGQPIEVKVLSDEALIESARAVSIGLIVTELLLNAIKYAFPSASSNAKVLVTYEVDGEDWKLSVSDNGIGKSDDSVSSGGGLGTAIVKALVAQLEAQIETKSDTSGLNVSITKASFTSRMPVKIGPAAVLRDIA
jgi:chemotaxis protein methyltransferase CheR